jgi:hypothetical protein
MSSVVYTKVLSEIFTDFFVKQHYGIVHGKMNWMSTELDTVGFNCYVINVNKT